MEITALLTTWNRPQLLAQSLPQIIREAASIGARLVVSDDQSREAETLSLVRSSIRPGVVAIQRAYVRDGRYTAHESTGQHAIWSFNEVLTTYPETTHILKLDDDTVMVEGAFARIVQAWEDATAHGLEVMAASGIQTKNEQTIREHGTWRETVTCCAAACLYSAYDIKLCFDGKTRHWSEIIAGGWDWAFSDGYRRKFKPNGKCVATMPSVVAHTGRHGAHVLGDDINVDYCGSLDGILCL